MKGRALIIAGGMGMLLMTVLLIGAEPAGPAPERAVQWEYGMYVESPGNFEWHVANDYVRATNATFFFERMGFPTGIEVSAQTGRVPPLVVNYLGRQGWELVEVARDARRDVYWFKRPR